MARKFNEIRLRAIDLERLGIQVSFVYADDTETLQQCRENAKKLKDAFFPEPKEEKFDKLGPDDVLWEADDNCDHEIVYPPGGGMKCRKCRGWFCY